MDNNYIIVLFKNKLKKKIINKFKTENNAIKFYENLIKKSNEIKFCKKYENGKKSDYEIGLLEKNSKKNSPVYIKDEIGRQIKIQLDDNDFQIKKISFYCLEEYLLDYKTKNKISFESFLNNHLKKDGFKLLSKLNNKIVLQNEDDYQMFTLKNSMDSDRFIDVLSDYFSEKGRNDVLFVKDYSTSQRKYLYKILEEKGFPKSYLFRRSTTHPQ